MDVTRFGFRKPPFTRELAISECLGMQTQEEAVSALVDAVQARMSAALIAPSGAGKTVALRMLKDRLPEARYQVRYVKVTGLSKRDLCKEISLACGLSPAGIYPALVRKLQDAFANASITDGIRPVLLFDEAHDLRGESLDMLRLLTNFEMDSRLVLAVVLAGQPPLRQHLARTAHEAVAGRLAHCATLRLLSRDECRDYIKHRCRIAGADNDPFDSDAHEAIFEMSRGNLRAIDRLAHKAILAADKTSATAISTREVTEARQNLWV